MLEWGKVFDGQQFHGSKDGVHPNPLPGNWVYSNSESSFCMLLVRRPCSRLSRSFFLLRAVWLDALRRHINSQG